MVSQRQARRERDREDFVRATTAAVQEADPKHASAYRGRIGENAGNTYREHLEDEIRKAVRIYLRIKHEVEQAADDKTAAADLWSPVGLEVKRKAARAYLRGLCKALLTYEDSYNKDDKEKLVRMENGFLREGEK